MISPHFQEKAPFPAESLIQLEFHKVLTHLARQTQTSYGRNRVESLQPVFDSETIRIALTEAAEASHLLEDDGPLPIGNGEDLRPILHHLQAEGTRLDPDQLKEVQAATEAVSACAQRMAGHNEYPLLKRHIENLSLLPDLTAAIRRCIGRRGEILDSASPALANLRQQLQSERSRSKRQLEKILADDNLQGVFQEKLITDRNGRYVLPVRTDHSGRLKGFVHDMSASGQTLFIEPIAALAGNNRIQTLLRDIEREEIRILLSLSAAVRKARLVLLDNQDILAHLDLRQAIARLSLLLGAVVPDLVTQPQLWLLSARHPLLVLARNQANESDEPIIPVDVRLEEDQSVLIISGPNTGGKTVALKTAALLVLMVRAGLPIPCASGSRVFPFAPVLADIGDEQSIEKSLSTFSGHLARLKLILAHADKKSLIVLDELGTGTDPTEGAALALATLDLLRQIGARVLATTHLHVIKGYAELEEGVANAAVEFDSETLQPTYRLHYGIPGASHAFTIAERMGLPSELLEKAAGYLGHGEREGMAIIEHLQVLKVALDEELSSVGSLRQEAELERNLHRKFKQDLEMQRQEILEQTRQEGKRLLADAEERLRELFSQVDPEQDKQKDRARVTHAIRTMQQNLPKVKLLGPENVPVEVTVGEILYVPSLAVDAEVVKINTQLLELDIGGKRLRQKMSALRQYRPRRFACHKKTQPSVKDKVRRRAFRPRLVLVGKRVEEAHGLLDRFLDEALLHNESRVEVVHGAGQGVLRRAVREFLADRPEVARFESAAVADGGENITVVELHA